ncbi:MAG: restriction endonuclease [Bacteroidales bacterium]|nr:restriction endonuclease [Bacteroidales bacterium]
MTHPEYINMTSEEFELTVFSYLNEIGSELDKFEIKHNTKESAPDGTYQIDVKASFEALGVTINVLVECKHHKLPIKRETIQVLNDRLQSLGAQKGIMFSTSPFQSGCIEYAEKHGIALVRMIDGRYNYQTKSFESKTIHYPEDLSKYVGEYIYNKNGDNYTTYNLQSGWIDGLKEFILK